MPAPHERKQLRESENNSHESEASPRKVLSPLEKYIGHELKLLEIVQKIWALPRKVFTLLVSQAGYGSGCSQDVSMSKWPIGYFQKRSSTGQKDWEHLSYGYLVISETRTTSNEAKETIRQIDNQQYDSHTNPCTGYIRISYQHQLVAIGKPERHVRKALHCGSNQQ